MWWVLGIVLLLLAGLGIGLPLLLGNREVRTLDAAARAQLPACTFLKTDAGWTHYELSGPESGPRVVLVHGFSSPMFIWERNRQALCEAGFRVLRYDLFGRGFSDRPVARYDENLFLGQLLGLLDHVGWREPVDLVGLSMGGAISIHFCDRYPERVNRLGLMAPAGLMRLPRISLLTRAPLFGDWFMRTFGDRVILEHMPRGITNDPDGLQICQAEYGRQLEFKGYKRALLATMRHFDLGHMDDVYRRVGRQQRRGILFWGTEDTVVSYALHRTVTEYVPWLEFVSVPGGGHAANFDQPGFVNPRLIAFLSA